MSTAKKVKAWQGKHGSTALAGFFGSLLLGRHGARCPRCRRNIGSRTQYFGEKKALMMRPVKFCLFCGVSLDAPYRP